MLDGNQSDNSVAECEVVSQMGIEGSSRASIVLLRTPAFSSAYRQSSNPGYKKIVPLVQLRFNYELRIYRVGR